MLQNKEKERGSVSMMFYVSKDDILKKGPYVKGDSLPDNMIWIDLFNMDREEELFIESCLNIDIPSREEMHEIEVSSRLYQKNNAIFMTATLISKSESLEPESHAITFIIFEDKLITVRYAELVAFRNFLNVVETLPSSQQSCQALFVELIECIIDRIADILERIGHELNVITNKVFRTQKQPNEKPDYQDILEEIGRKEDLISKTRESLVTLGRMASYAMQSPIADIHDEAQARLSSLIADITSLSDHVTFLSSKSIFLLDGTLGMINIEQNNIIKIFSVAAVVFLPPTLIASIYGMNFEFIPELKWPFGYPLALLLMIFSSWAPYQYFKRRKWF